ncbi:MAG: hypothetical protein PHV33_08675 [Elusimicrobiales bacterium]|nr:hypothetical protein [Elusimicrobiales bacterium]
MKFLEKMLHNDRIIMYNAGEFANVTNELVAAVNWPKDVDMLSFSFNPFAPGGGFVRHDIDGDYVIRYMFGCKTSALKPLGRPLKSSPIIARAPKSVGEALAVTKATLCDKSAAQRKRKGPAYQKELLNYLGSIKKGKVKSVLLFKNGKNVGIASMIDSVRLDGKKGSTFTWLWLDKKLPVAQYEDARFKATKWVKDNAQEYMASANFDYDRESQRNDCRFGLKPYRIFFARKK